MTDIHEALANPEAPGPGHDAQTRPTGQPVAVDRTDPYGSAERITVAQTPPDYAERYKPTPTKPTSTSIHEDDVFRPERNTASNRASTNRASTTEG